MSLPNFPKPTALLPVDPQAERDARLTLFVGLMRDADHGNMPDYTAPLPSDPAHQVLSTSAYRDQLRVKQINHAVLSNLILFAEGTDLDNLAVTPPFDVLRLEGESDDRFRERIQLRIRGWSPGTFDYYEFHARSASVDVRDVALSMATNKVMLITILAGYGIGLPDDSLLDKVQTAVTASGVKLNNDTPVVKAVDLVPLNLVVTLYLEPDAVPGIKEKLEEEFPLIFDKNRGLGRGVATSWLDSQHHLAGVKRVDLSLKDDLEAQPNQCVYLDSYLVLIGKPKENVLQ